ncbi:hypothetical protein DTW90_36855 [Neorhizobium sp. P12A]|uniref:amidohydrolase family protein n=1 Tax=Neorhizobium sp. P12A TaxID=2268027 RepID=UPI0011EE7FB3|nr:amidohydrolase family protein [Neorhizobium sp. P12A]KAA0682190.1 hypothetical protein DTW90_36855 [Neorhizobium sp. P12A]
MLPFDLVIKNGRIVSETSDFVGDVAINGETIVALGHNLSGTSEINASGKLVIPGAIDGHVHMRTERPKFAYDETFATGSVAAAFGGTTTMIDQIQADPGIRLGDALRDRRSLGEGESCIDFSFHMNIREESQQRLDEIADVIDQGITSFKWFMAIPGWGISDEFLMKGMLTVGDAGALSIVHAENQGVLNAMRWRTPRRDISRFTDNYPASAEAAAIALALSMAEVANCRTLVFHNTCTQGVDAIRRAKARGVKAFGEVCLAWLTHNDEVFAGDPIAAIPFLLTPPIRTASDQRALWEGLRSGDLDIVSTDHALMRRVPEERALELAEYFGLSINVPPPNENTPRDAEGNRLMPLLTPGGIETRLPLVFSLGVATGRISLHRWVQICSSQPARLFDLDRKGQILPGFDADIVIFDPHAERTYSVNNLHSNTDYSVWEGWNCRGVVGKTLVRGKLVVDGNRFVATRDHGKFISRKIGRPSYSISQEASLS